MRSIEIVIFPRLLQNILQQTGIVGPASEFHVRNIKKDAKELVIIHMPVWNTIMLLNLHDVKREGLIVQESDLELLKAFAESKDSDYKASQVSFVFFHVSSLDY